MLFHVVFDFITHEIQRTVEYDRTTTIAENNVLFLKLISGIIKQKCLMVYT